MKYFFKKENAVFFILAINAVLLISLIICGCIFMSRTSTSTSSGFVFSQLALPAIKHDRSTAEPRVLKTPSKKASMAPAPVPVAKQTGGKTAYLTFDDGPSRNNTVSNLDTLKHYGIKGTFFVLPKRNADDIYERILEEGHIIANHSYSHNYNQVYKSPESFKAEVTMAREFILQKFKYRTGIFRFPGGSRGHKGINIVKCKEILKEMGYRYFDWDASTNDTDPHLASKGDIDKVAQILTDNAVNKAGKLKKYIVLMHDDKTKIYTAKALPGIIEGLAGKGYHFDTLDHY